MDELRGSNLQIVLHVKEGLGFGFLRSPFVVSGSLNGYMLETDSSAPIHAPIFDAELVWEAEKRRFRSLRIQNVPIKVEVFTTSTQGRKDKVGYIMLSLLGAQPCPSNKIVDIKYTWHKLLGVRSEGKCCHPQLMLSLTVEDRINTMTPRNELRMFHSNEVAYPSSAVPSATRSILATYNEYIQESKKTVSSLDLQPRLLCDEGLIQIGNENHLFVLSFIIGAVENIDLLLPEPTKEAVCFVTYSVFTHNVQTDRVAATPTGGGSGLSTSAHFNQRTALRLRTSLAALARYFAECPALVTRVCAGDKDIGICSLDLRKLIPTEDINEFITSFCKSDRSLTINERCFIVKCEARDSTREARRPFVDVEMCLKYDGKDKVQKSALTARSATELQSQSEKTQSLECRSGSCTQLDQELGASYTNIASANTARYKDAAGAQIIQNDIAELIKKMCDSFALTQEKWLSKPITGDMQIQCEEDLERNIEKEIVQEKGETESQKGNIEDKIGEDQKSVYSQDLGEGTKPEARASQSETCISSKDLVKLALSPCERNEIMQKFVRELEDWREKQKELYRYQMKAKEEYHLDQLSKEWEKKRSALELKLGRGIERCRNLAQDLSRATDDFRLKGFRNTQREKKLVDAKQALESHYTSKYQELREASAKMEADMNHQLTLKDMKIEELQLKVAQLEKQLDVVKNNVKNIEMEAEQKYSGLTKDQTASLIQELRCLEEKLESAVRSKAFFKEQWGRCVRELHLAKLSTRKQMLTQLRQRRVQLGDMGLNLASDPEDLGLEIRVSQSQTDLTRLKDDFYMDILANTPPLDGSCGNKYDSGPDMEILGCRLATPKNLIDEKVSELIQQRDALIQQDNPNENKLTQLNNEIRSLLINCGT